MKENASRRSLEKQKYVTLSFQWNGSQISGFDCSGHAGSVPEGQNIVCAAVSILTTTCVNALETVAGITPDVHAESGHMTVSLPRTNHDTQIILRTMLRGFIDLSEAYPDLIKLSDSEQ